MKLSLKDTPGFQSDITFDRKRLKNVEIKKPTEETRKRKNILPHLPNPQLQLDWVSHHSLKERAYAKGRGQVSLVTLLCYLKGGEFLPIKLCSSHCLNFVIVDSLMIKIISNQFTCKFSIFSTVDVLDNQGSSSFNFNSSFVRWRNFRMFLDTWLSLTIILINTSCIRTLQIMLWMLLCGSVWSHTKLTSLPLLK